ncbi:MAG TPA: hemerythrin domain-containing protein [Gammaproteobacteria bacterium]|jgi:hypothetical protein
MEYLPGRLSSLEPDPFEDTEYAMLMSFFSRKAKQGVDTPAGTAPHELPYDPALVTALTLEHRSLVSRLVQAKRLAQQGRYGEVMDTLHEFSQGLAEHLKRESAVLHPYLGAHLRGEDRDYILREMYAGPVHVKKAVDGFLKHYAGYPVGERNVGMFVVEIDGVSEEFCERIEKEEATIYTLYVPPEAY